MAGTDRGSPGPDGESRPARPRPPLRLAIRMLLGVIAVGVAYVAVTFTQVWWAARQDDAQPADAIVVMGAAQYDGRPSPVLAARLDHAASLWQGGLAPVIVVTGGKQEGDRVTQGFAGFEYLRNAGIPEEALLVETGGTDTYTELSATAHILTEEGLGRDVVLVSSPSHALRLDGIASEVGLVAHVSPIDGDPSLRELARETAAVAVGRFVGYRRFSNLS